MKISNAQRKENIIKNVSYLIKSRGETKTSFSARSGITRTTIYNILDGTVNSIQQSTVNRISDFFGVSCEEIECYDLEKIENKRKVMSLDGNKNPCAVPLIPESEFIISLDKTIGRLIVDYPLTYFFDNEADLVAMQVETSFSELFLPKDILIIKRCSIIQNGYLELLITLDGKLDIRERTNKLVFNNDKLVGYIIEERV